MSESGVTSHRHTGPGNGVDDAPGIGAGDGAGDGVDDAGAPALAPRRSRRQRMLRTGLLLLALVFAVTALAAQWDDVRNRIGDLSVGHLVAAGAGAVVSLLAAFLAWRETLAGLGDRVRLVPAARIYYLGQLAKYVPGSVWSIIGQMEHARAIGIRRDRSGAAGLVVIMVSLTTSISLGVLAVPALFDLDSGGYAWVLVLLPVLAVVLWPAVLNRLIETGLRLVRRPPLDAPFTGGVLARIASATTVSNTLLGVVTWLVATDLGGSGWLLLPLCIGAYNIAASIAFVVIPLPAGAGLREAVLVLLLAPEIGTASATLLAIVVRLLLTLTDLGVAATAAVASRSGQHTTPAAAR